MTSVLPPGVLIHSAAQDALLVMAQKLALILARAAGLFSIAPLGSEIIPSRVRVTAAIVVSLSLYPVVPDAPEGIFIMALCAEAAVGLMAALIARFPLAAIESGMQIVSVSAGLGIASLLNPATDEEVHALNQLFASVALLIFFCIGGHHQLVSALYLSFVHIPPGGAHLGMDLLRIVTQLGAELFVLAVQVAAPVMLIALALNLALALIARAAPTVNIFSVTLIAVLLCGLMVIIRALPTIVEAVRGAVERTSHYFLLGFST